MPVSTPKRCPATDAPPPSPPGHPRVSIVIPAWNAARTLARCLDSILTQRFPGTEIIVVDDGSNDGTDRVADGFGRFANLVLLRQSNQGVSVARNAGLAVARGRYVMFMDADDVLAPRALERRWSRAESSGCQVLLDNAWWHAPGQPVRPLLPARLGDWSGSGRDWIVSRLPLGQLKHFVWLQFIRRDFLVSSGLRFVAGISHQDILWTNALLMRADRVCYVPLLSYHYWLAEGTLSHPRLSSRRLAAASHYLQVARELAGMVEAATDDDLRRALSAQVVEEGIAALHFVRRLDDRDRIALFRLLQESGHVERLLLHAEARRQQFRVLRRATRYYLWRARQGALDWASRPSGRMRAAGQTGGD